MPSGSRGHRWGFLGVIWGFPKIGFRGFRGLGFVGFPKIGDPNKYSTPNSRILIIRTPK